MVDYKYSSLFKEDGIQKQLIIRCGNITLTNDDIYQESFTLDERLCSTNEITFGSCESSYVKFTVANHYTSFLNQNITVDIVLNGHTDAPLRIGTYTVVSDTLTADRSQREVIAYDAIYKIINSDFSAWYNSLTFPMSLKAFRDAFFSYVNVTQENATLVNDSMTVAKTIEPETLSGKDIICSICQINGVFGHIGRDNKFKYVVLNEISEGLYPSDTLYPANNLYPQETNINEDITKSKYTSCQYEDFECKKIELLQIRQESGDIGAIAGSGTNHYIIENNFLVYGLSATALQTVANNALSIMNRMSNYRPCKVDCKGNICLEVGDNIRLYTSTDVFVTYILERTLSGIQILFDTFIANGSEYRSEEVNSVATSIIQLKGKTNVLKRDVEHLESTVYDAETGQSKIEQTAQAITSEVTRATQAEGSLSSSIKQTADAITSEVTRATNAEGTLSSSIKQTSDSISAEVTRATNAEGTLSGRIDVTDRNVSAKVSSSGGNQSFGWSLTDNGFSLVSNGSEVFKCNSGGITVNGYATASELNTTNLNVQTINGVAASAYTAAGNAQSTADTANTTAGNAQTTANSAYSIACSKLSASDIDAEFINGVYSHAETFSAETVKTSKLQVTFDGRLYVLTPQVVNGYLVLGTKYK